MSKTKLETAPNSNTSFLNNGQESTTAAASSTTAPPPKPSEPETWRQMMKAWPKSTFLIVGNEFCEKYSYLGMRSILTLYFLNVMKVGDKSATVWFTAFTLVASLTPLIGSFVADGLIGKYWTIVAASVLFVIGQLLLAFSSFHSPSSFLHPWTDCIALIIIALSAGGTKPCVTAFGADQFDPNHTKMLSLFFALVYYFVNFGSATSAFVAPLFRSMSCSGHDNCYPLAFGVSAMLMILATIVFLIGSYSYKKKAPKGNIFGDVTHVVKGAIFSSGPKRSHWLEGYLNSHSCKNDTKCIELKQKKRDKSACQKVDLIKDIQALISVLVMYLPLPIYWALYDQQGSVWLIQGIQMDCRIWGNTLLLPDQIHLLNPVLCLILIPLFQVIIYPCLSKCFNVTLLRKMVKTLSDLPPENHAFVSVMNSLKPGCSVAGIGNYSFPELPYNSSLINNKQTQKYEMLEIPFSNGNNNVTFKFQNSCKNKNYANEFTTSEIGNKKIYNLILTELGAAMVEVNPEKPRKGTGEFSLSIVMALNDINYQGHIALCRVNPKSEYPYDPKKPENFFYFQTDFNGGNDSDLSAIVPYQTNGPNSSDHFVSAYIFKAIRPGKLVYFICHFQCSTGYLQIDIVF
uniref:Uncharacterized protein n=1 Tax=Panagrolaimus sp. PS1159 TaxID=55785 RepID=A0AC35FL66_9BILA